MSNVSISFVSQIHAHAKAQGVDLTRQEVDALSATINSVTRVDENNQVSFDLGLGPVATLDQAITMCAIGMGHPAAAKSTATSIPANASATERAVIMNQAAKAGSDAAKQGQAEALVRSFGNPWRTNNRTHMAYVSNVAPDMASRLRREAGVNS